MVERPRQEARGYIVQQEIIRKWVEENNVKPALQVGDDVNIIHFGEWFTGEITAVNTETAEYRIFCPMLGHVRKGSGIRGVSKPYEHVLKAWR
ncbi:MAG: hypothetical protein GY751_08185 [Bacteroidetes bacterium]|nr:hypothetical protein [Bacteroidota bacterium]